MANVISVLRVCFYFTTFLIAEIISFSGGSIVLKINDLEMKCCHCITLGVDLFSTVD